MNKNTIFSIIVIVLLALGFWFLRSNKSVSLAPTSSPVSSVSPVVTPTSTPNTNKITITTPKANDIVNSPITVSGQASVFENQFSVQMKDSTGKVVYRRDGVMTDRKDNLYMGNYSIKIPVPVGFGMDFKIEVFDLSAKGDGSYAAYASVPVKLKTILSGNVYAGFTAKSGDGCSDVTLYPREIISSPEYVYMSLVELLKGPGPDEVALGASTQIPNGVQINSFKMVGDTVYVDFDQTLQQGVSGSCRVQGIRNQITTTLKQFLGINKVVISVNGKTDGILKP